MPTFKDCIAVLLKAAGEDVLTKEQAQAVIDEIHEFAKFKKKTLSDDLNADMILHIKEMHSNALLGAAIEKRNAIINLAKRKELKKFVGKFNDPATGLKAYLGGTVKMYEGGRLSIDAVGKSLAHKYLGRMITDLEQEGVFEIFSRGNLEREIAQEMWELHSAGKPGISGSPEARKIAEIVHKYQTLAVDRINRSGAYIKKLPGYIVRQSHDMLKIRRAGFEAWFNEILPRLDAEKTFGTADPTEFLRHAYDALQSGLHFRHNAGEIETNHLFGFTGPANIAKKVSAERLLYFKSADDWFEYNEKFGTASLKEAVVYGLEHMARNTALMEGLGTNPVANFDQVLKDLKHAYRDDPHMLQRLKSQSIQNLLKEVDGTSRIPVNLSAARVSSGIRIIQNMSKLGGAMLSSISDIPFHVAEMRYQGHSMFTSYLEAFQSILRGRGTDEQKQIARLVGLGFDGMTNEIMSRFSAQDSVPGTLSKTQQIFFKLNLLTWWNDVHRTGVGLIMSGHLADQSHLAFSALDADTRRIFSLYDITESDWDLVRALPQKDLNGTKFITPEGIQDIPDAAIAQHLNIPESHTNKIQAFKDKLETKFMTYFQDRADFAIPIPGASERAMMNQGTAPGTILGETMRFMMQFKSFPLTVIHRAVGRELYGKGADSIAESLFKGKGDLVGLAHLIIGTTLFGYMSMVAKDIAKGRNPREMNSSKTVFAAMAQGGGFGIYGDFLFGEFSRYGRSALATAAGPTLGQIDDLAELWTNLRNGEDVAANVMRMAMNNTPFINLFYTRMALDYLILYQLQEMANPGYLQRMEARIARENDQRFYLPPSSVIPYGGGDRVLEAVR